MIDTNDPEVQEGIRLYKEGVKYNSPLLKNAKYHRGYATEERASKCGYLRLSWNLPANYKTSADLRTLFI